MTEHRIWAYGDNVNTDVIFPGKYTYTLRTPAVVAASAVAGEIVNPDSLA